ncbi:transposase [Cystobacter fuscus]|nr:transposase [Cystobacter fuscus]
MREPVPDETWKRVAPRLPVATKQEHGRGQSQVYDRAAWEAIVFVHRPGIGRFTSRGDLEAEGSATSARHTQRQPEQAHLQSLHHVVCSCEEGRRFASFPAFRGDRMLIRGTAFSGYIPSAPPSAPSCSRSC